MKTPCTRGQTLVDPKSYVFVGPVEPLTQASMERVMMQFAEAGISADHVRLPMRARLDSLFKAYYGSTGE